MHPLMAVNLLLSLAFFTPPTLNRFMPEKLEINREEWSNLLDDTRFKVTQGCVKFPSDDEY